MSQTTENHTCPRRAETGMDRADGPFVGGGPNLDTYEPGHGLTNQSRGCSFCGSMSPEDFLEAVRNGLEIGPTDKSYKLYVGKPMQGKFYTQHFSEAQGWEFDALWKDKKVVWGYPGYPYVGLYIPGPSEASKVQD